MGSYPEAVPQDRPPPPGRPSPGHHVILDVHLLLVRDGHLLLTRRRGGYGDGMWHLPSGKTEPGENVEAAVIREAREEVGVMVDPVDLRCALVLQEQVLGVTHPELARS